MGQFPLRHPGEGRAAEGLRFVGSPVAVEEFQEHALLRVIMLDGFKQFADGDFDAEFLTQFAHQAILKALTWLALAAWEFPQPAEMRPGVALCDEQFAVAEDQSGTDFNGGESWSACITSHFSYLPTLL